MVSKLSLEKLMCRHRADVHFPCNWNFKGFCGVEAHKCEVKSWGVSSL